MEYFESVQAGFGQDLLWNVPEQKRGIVSVVGGNSQNFRTALKTAEAVASHAPVRQVNLVLPETLRPALPPLDNLIFLSATDTGSFCDASELTNVVNDSDFSVFVGDFSRNNTTRRAVASACRFAEKPLLIARDTLDLIAENETEAVLANERVMMMGSVAQLQKILRAIYYPRMLLLSQSLVQIVETLHKFTLSYPTGVMTYAGDKLLTARGGEIYALALDETNFSPISIWGSDAIAKITALNLYNPKDFARATIAAVME